MPSYTLPFAQPQRVTGDPPPTGTSEGSASLTNLCFQQSYNNQAVFSNGGNTRYIVAVNTLAAGTAQAAPAAIRASLHILKSSSGGAAGSWSEVGTPGAKELQVLIRFHTHPSETWVNFSAIQDCSKIIVARWVPTDLNFGGTGDGPYSVILSSFDMSTDTWDADLSSVGDSNCPQVAENAIGLTTTSQTYLQLHLVKRPSDGKYVLLWSGAESLTPFIEYNDFTAAVVDAGVSASGSDGAIDANGYFSSASHGAFSIGNVGSYIHVAPTANYIITGVSGSSAILLGVDSSGRSVTGLTWQMNGPNVIYSPSRPFTSFDLFRSKIKIQGGPGWNTLWSGSVAGIVVGITNTPFANSAIVCATPYTSPGTFPPPIGPVAGLGDVDGVIRVSDSDFDADFTRAFISVFDGVSSWTAAQQVFGEPGEGNWYAASGAIVGDESRVHCLGWKQYRAFDGQGHEDSTAYQLVRTFKSDNTFDTQQDIFYNYGIQATTSAPNGPNATPVSRMVGTQTEIIWPYLFEWYNGNGRYAPDQTAALKVLRFLSADNPTVTNEIVLNGAQGGLANGWQSTKWNRESCSNYPGATNVLDSDLFLLTIGPGNNLAGYDREMFVFSEASPWDAGVQLFQTPNAALHPLGAIAGTGSYPGFIGIACTNNPFGEYQYDDIFYYEVSFGGSTNLSLNPITAPDGAVGVPYSYQPTIDVGGVLPYQGWTIVVGSLPDGLTIDLTSGLISGTPTTPGTFTFTIQLRDAICQLAQANGSIFVPGIGPPLAIICDSPPAGTVGVPYGPHQFPASGGTAPYTYSVLSGSLPDGLVLDTTTGILSGIPTATGTFAFTIQVEDSLGATADTGVCTIVISSAGGISLICNSPPNGFVGEFYSHQLGLTNGVPPYTVTIIVGVLPLGLSISSTGLITGTPTTIGLYTFTVHVVDSIGQIANVTCSILISAFPGTGCPDADGGGPG